MLKGGLLNSARQGEFTYLFAANSMLYTENCLESAIEIALEGCNKGSNSRLVQRLGELYIMAGEPFLAKAIFSQLVGDFSLQSINSANLKYTSINAVKALVDESVGLFYVPIPKCGSSTIKNYISFGKYQKDHGGTVHFKLSSMLKTIPISEIETKYKDYTKIVVVRDPIDRVVSYIGKNVNSGSLVNESFGSEKFFNLDTNPNTLEVSKKFFCYRQKFVDFRHHTDPCLSHLGGSDHLVESATLLEDIDLVRDKISRLYGTDIPDKRSMTSDNISEDQRIMKKILGTRLLNRWYAEDTTLCNTLRTSKSIEV